MNQRTALIILGMHRSGTSAITGALEILGIQLGNNLYKAQKDVNEKGFFEDADVVDINEAAMRITGYYWDEFLNVKKNWWHKSKYQLIEKRVARLVQEKSKSSEIWGMKDPRLCRVLPLWLNALNSNKVSPLFILAIRNPIEVSLSLRKRNGFSSEKSLLIWLRHNLDAERYTRGYPRVIIDFDELIGNPVSAVSSIQKQLSLKFPVEIGSAEKQLMQFISKDLRNHMSSDFDENNSISLLAKKTYELLTSESGKDGSNRHLEFDKLSEQLESEISNLPKWIVHELESRAMHGAYYHHIYINAYRSIWWKLSWPIRKIEKYLRNSDLEKLDEPF